MTQFFYQCIIACRHDYSELDDAMPQAINQDIGFSIQTRLPVTRWVTNKLQYQYNTNNLMKSRERV